MKNTLTQEQLKAEFRYDPDTGSWFTLDGTPRGYKRRTGYKHLSIRGKEYSAHRLAFLYMTGKYPDDEVDHINQVRDDNRWENLREATRSQNRRNVKWWSHNTSGYKGVYFHKKAGKYAAQIQHLTETIYLGLYDCPREASHAYNKAAVELHGEFAVLNPI